MCERWAMRHDEGIVRKNLARVRLQKRGDLAEENFAELAQFFFADAADAGEIAFACGIIPRHLPQRHVGENDVGRHVALVGEFFAECAQALEQSFVAGDFADVAGRFVSGAVTGLVSVTFVRCLRIAAPALVSSSTLNFSAVCRRKPSRTSSRPMAAHSGRLCSLPMP